MSVEVFIRRPDGTAWEGRISYNFSAKREDDLKLKFGGSTIPSIDKIYQAYGVSSVLEIAPSRLSDLGNLALVYSFLYGHTLSELMKVDESKTVSYYESWVNEPQKWTKPMALAMDWDLFCLSYYTLLCTSNSFKSEPWKVLLNILRMMKQDTTILPAILLQCDRTYDDIACAEFWETIYNGLCNKTLCWLKEQSCYTAYEALSQIHSILPDDRWMLFLKVYDAKEQDWEFDDEDYVSIIPETCCWQNWAADDKSGAAMTGEQLLNFVNNTLFPTLKKLPVNASTPVKKAIVQTTFADANNYMKDGVLLRQVINVIDELDLSDYEESHAFGDIYESILKELQSAGSAGEFYTPRAVTDFMAQMIQPKIGETMADFACGTGGFITSWLKVLQKQVQSTADAKKYGESVYGIEKKQFPYMLCITNLLLHGLDIPKVYHDNTLLKDVLDYTEDDQFDVILMNPPYGGSEKADVKNHFPDDLASSETADLFMAVIMYRLKKNGRAAVILPDGFLFGLDNAKVNLKKKLLKEFNLHTIIRMPSSVFAPYTSITTNILFFDNTKPTEETWFYRLDMPSDRKHFSKTKPMELKHFDPVVEWWNDRQEITLDGFDKAKCYSAAQIADELGYNLDQCGYPHKEEEILAPMDLMQRYQEERASLNAEIDRVLAELSALLGGAVE